MEPRNQKMIRRAIRKYISKNKNVSSRTITNEFHKAYNVPKQCIACNLGWLKYGYSKDIEIITIIPGKKSICRKKVLDKKVEK